MGPKWILVFHLIPLTQKLRLAFFTYDTDARVEENVLLVPQHEGEVVRWHQGVRMLGGLWEHEVRNNP